MRFRNYLAEQYKKEDTVNNEKVVLPITTIYVLGFKLPEIDTPCLKVERNYKNQINKTVMETKSEFVEKLTHDSFIVQVERITDRFQTRLDKLLSLFAQDNFIDNTKITKRFDHEIDSEDLKITTDILHYSGTDPEERKKIEVEQEAIRTINAMFSEKDKKYDKVVENFTKVSQQLSESEKQLSQKDKQLSEKDELIEKLKKQLELK
jgi:uncharacterized protein (DUF3084 family)